MEICLECGIPEAISGRYQWTSGGSIISRSSGHRSVVVDCNQLALVHDLFTFLDGQRAGIIIAEAQRKAIAAEVRRTLGRLLGRLNLVFIKRKAFGRLRERATAYGFGDVRVRDYEHKGRAVVEVANPFFLPFVEADLKAIWEALEGIQPVMACERIGGGRYLYTLEAAEEKEGARPLLKKPLREPAPVPEAPVSGNVRYRTCSSCSAPIEASRFSWNLKAGTIYDSMRETHVCVVSTATLLGVFRDLELHYGPVVGELLTRANKNYTRGLIRGNQILKDLSDEEFLRSLGIRGAGSLAGLEENPRLVELRLRNPWHMPVLAGEIAGWFEFKYGVDVQTSWTADAENAVLRIRRAVPA